MSNTSAGFPHLKECGPIEVVEDEIRPSSRQMNFPHLKECGPIEVFHFFFDLLAVHASFRT